ncbi:MAG: hypothetical protein ACTSVL_01915, partial [Promethearchaeota archaeon]
MKELKDAAEKIKNLEIQGASNIAIFAVEQMISFSNRNSHLPRKELWKQLVKAEEILSKSRSTEPSMRNGLMFILGKIKNDENHGIADTKIPIMVEIYGNEYLKIMRESKRRIA